MRVIYIDPPYDTGNKLGVQRQNSWARTAAGGTSQWLEFYQRLLLARDLLTSDGVILVSIDDENRARLELLMDRCFRGGGVGSLWRTKDTGITEHPLETSAMSMSICWCTPTPGFAFNGQPPTAASSANRTRINGANGRPSR